MLIPLILPALLAATPPDPDTQKSIAEADRLEFAGDWEKALALYRKILPGNEGEVLWRMAGAYSDMSEAAAEDRKKALDATAVELARWAVRAAPGSADAHSMLAVVLGRMALFASAKEGVKISREVKEEAERAIAIDKGKFLPYLVLGIWNREITDLGFLEKAAAEVLFGGVPEASLEGSARNLEKAVSLNPDSIKAHYELAITCWEMGEKEKARKEMRQAATRRPNRFLDRSIQAKAREKLEKFGG